MKFKNKLSILLCLPTIFNGGGASKAKSVCNRENYSSSQNICKDYYNDNYDDDVIKQEEPSDSLLSSQDLIKASGLAAFSAFSIRKIMNHNAESIKNNESFSPRRLPDESKLRQTPMDLKSIKNNILLSPMKLPNESNLRANPMKYFEKNGNNIYLNNVEGNGFDCGKFSFPSLESIEKEANSVKADKLGKLDIIYGGGSNYHNVEIAKLIDSGYFDLVVPASNFNAIETLGPSDGNKKFIDYLDDPTQGPDCMEKFPSTSLALLHIFNGKNKDVAMGLIPGCDDLIEQKSEQCELNLLKPYEITTSNGYVVDGNLPIGFENKGNDSKYRVAYIEGAPVWYEGGYKFDACNRSRMQNNDVFDKNFKLCKNPKRVNIFIDACIPYEESGYTGTSEENIKAHLRRHYKMLINLCKAKKIKRALFPLSGSGVFGVPQTWHYEILHELKDLIKNSGTHFVLNAFKKPNFKNIPNCKSFSFAKITSDNSLKQLMIK